MSCKPPTTGCYHLNATAGGTARWSEAKKPCHAPSPFRPGRSAHRARVGCIAHRPPPRPGRTAGDALVDSMDGQPPLIVQLQLVLCSTLLLDGGTSSHHSGCFSRPEEPVDRGGQGLLGLVCFVVVACEGADCPKLPFNCKRGG